MIFQSWSLLLLHPLLWLPSRSYRSTPFISRPIACLRKGEGSSSVAVLGRKPFAQSPLGQQHLSFPLSNLQKQIGTNCSCGLFSSFKKKYLESEVWFMTHTHTHTAELLHNGSKKKASVENRGQRDAGEGTCICPMASDARKSRLQPDSKKSVFPSNPVAKVQGSSLILGDFNMWRGAKHSCCLFNSVFLTHLCLWKSFSLCVCLKD